MSVTGSCFCGHVRFELSRDPTFACHCHCKSCQHAAGAPFVTWVTFPRATFDVTEGAISEYVSSAGVQRGHCAKCGTTLTYANDDRPGEIDIALVALHDRLDIEPRAHIWLQDKASWLELDDSLPKYRTTVTAGDLVE